MHVCVVFLAAVCVLVRERLSILSSTLRIGSDRKRSHLCQHAHTHTQLTINMSNPRSPARPQRNLNPTRLRRAECRHTATHSRKCAQCATRYPRSARVLAVGSLAAPQAATTSTTTTTSTASSAALPTRLANVIPLPLSNRQPRPCARGYLLGECTRAAHTHRTLIHSVYICMRVYINNCSDFARYIVHRRMVHVRGRTARPACVWP